MAVLVLSCKSNDNELARVEVKNTHHQAVANAVIRLENDGVFTEVGKTNTEGQFYLDQIPGVYNITVESDDYINDTVKINNWPESKRIVLIRPMDSLYVRPVFIKKINGVSSLDTTIHSSVTLRSVDTDPYPNQNRPCYCRERWGLV